MGIFFLLGSSWCPVCFFLPVTLGMDDGLARQGRKKNQILDQLKNEKKVFFMPVWPENISATILGHVCILTQT